MKFKYYFAKDFQTSDNHEIESLRTHYYRGKKEDVIKAIEDMAKEFKFKVKSIDEERGEVIFDHMDYSGTATVTAISYTEMGVDFAILTYNILPTAPGKKHIEKFYAYLDKNLDYKGVGLYK